MKLFFDLFHKSAKRRPPGGESARSGALTHPLRPFCIEEYRLGHPGTLTKPPRISPQSVLFCTHPEFVRKTARFDTCVSGKCQKKVTWLDLFQARLTFSVRRSIRNAPCRFDECARESSALDNLLTRA